MVYNDSEDVISRLNFLLISTNDDSTTGDVFCFFNEKLGNKKGSCNQRKGRQYCSSKNRSYLEKICRHLNSRLEWPNTINDPFIPCTCVCNKTHPFFRLPTDSQIPGCYAPSEKNVLLPVAIGVTALLLLITGIVIWFCKKKQIQTKPRLKENSEKDAVPGYLEFLRRTSSRSRGWSWRRARDSAVFNQQQMQPTLPPNHTFNNLNTIEARGTPSDVGGYRSSSFLYHTPESGFEDGNQHIAVDLTSPLPPLPAKENNQAAFSSVQRNPSDVSNVYNYPMLANGKFIERHYESLKEKTVDQKNDDKEEISSLETDVYEPLNMRADNDLDEISDELDYEKPLPVDTFRLMKHKRKDYETIAINAPNPDGEGSYSKLAPTTTNNESNRLSRDEETDPKTPPITPESSKKDFVDTPHACENPKYYELLKTS